jgi:predicted small lipoprotein YifL
MLRDSTATMRALAAITTLAVVVPLAGCGIKGPLTLPPAAPAASAPAAAAGAPPPAPAAAEAATAAKPVAPPAGKP